MGDLKKNYERITQEDGREFINMPSNKTNPCLNCGACCSNFRVSFYHGEMDVQSGGFVPSELTTQVNSHFACMSGTEQGGKCIALNGEVGCENSCSIYENRPSPCREFEVWDKSGKPNPQCQTLRSKNGIALL
jgi:Fe-S-cluster containining protein